jgi:large subunit ribosomal protein L3
MIEGMIGKKIGMTQLFEADGTTTPVTVIEAGPCVVVQRLNPDKHGYEAAQVGLVDAKAAQRANRPMQGHHEKAGVPPTRMLREFRIDDDAEVKAGDPVSVGIFEGVDKVDIIGKSKGKGFQGVMKRHGFGGGRATHGSMFHRAPGSIGQSAYPSKVFKGMRGPGQMGNSRVTVKNLPIVRIDAERNLLLVRGSVPGPRGGKLVIRRSQGATRTAPAATPAAEE